MLNQYYNPQRSPSLKGTSLKNAIHSHAEEAHGKGQCYNDSAERTALRNFLKHCKPFQKFWISYFGKPSNAKIMDDPMGLYNVDLGIVDRDDTSVIHGLIEVDVFNEWGNDWPSHYKKFHLLERKFKYWRTNDYPFLAVTFNKFHNSLVCTTRPYMEKCVNELGVERMFVKKSQCYDKLTRCPLNSEHIHWFKL